MLHANLPQSLCSSVVEEFKANRGLKLVKLERVKECNIHSSNDITNSYDSIYCHIRSDVCSETPHTVLSTRNRLLPH